jgi:glutathione S-transferase
MASLILHSYRRCPFAIRVRMVLEEKNIPYSVAEESLANPSPELLALHPEGRVPLLRVDGRAIYESSVITEYLNEAYPGPSLAPSHPMARAEMRLWTYWVNTAFKADLDAYKYRKPESEIGTLQILLELHLAKIEKALEASPFLQGKTLGLADIHVFPFVRQLSKVNGVDFIPSKTYAWLESILARPSFARVMAKA